MYTSIQNIKKNLNLPSNIQRNGTQIVTQRSKYTVYIRDTGI